MTFSDRTEAGHRLATVLASRVWYEPPIVLALGPEGAPIAFEIASALRAELDLFQVRPFAVPGFGEREVGAVASGGMRVIHAKVRDDLGISDDAIRDVTERIGEEIRRDEQPWRARHTRADFAGHVVLLVDDRIGPDTRMDAAAMVARMMGARRVIAAAPIGLRASVEQAQADADEVVCLAEVADRTAMNDAYADRAAPGTAELRGLLERAEEWRAPMIVEGA
jgi:putative phosphoribosyl transferase